MLFHTELHHLGQNNTLLKACGDGDESACHEMLCRDIHKHGVDLHIQDISMYASRDFVV